MRACRETHRWLETTTLERLERQRERDRPVTTSCPSRERERERERGGVCTPVRRFPGEHPCESRRANPASQPETAKQTRQRVRSVRSPWRQAARRFSTNVELRIARGRDYLESAGAVAIRFAPACNYCITRRAVNLDRTAN